MNETTDIARWLFAVLSAVDGAQGVYNGTIPDGADEPLILFQRQGGSDRPVFGGGPRLTEATYLIRATAATEDATALASLADAIDAALEGAVAPATSTDLGANIVGVLRETPFELVEVVDGVEYRHLGGIYVIRAQEERE